MPADAWTQLNNNYPDDPVSCDNSAEYRCIRWPKTSNNLSINVDVYPHPSLDSETSVNFDSILEGSVSEWNGAPARNPHYQLGGSGAPVWVGYGPILPETVYGVTLTYYQATSPYRIVGADVTMSSYIEWNTSFK